MRGVQIVRAASAWAIGGQVDFVFGAIDKRNVDAPGFRPARSE